MKNIITVTLPRNIEDKELHLFSPYTTYSTEDLKILSLTEVFITYTGLCVNDEGLIKESHHSYLNKYDDFINESSYYINKACDDKNNLIELDNKNRYLVIHHPWSTNYWHWMTESILRVWMVRKKIKHLTLLLPGHFREVDFIKGSLVPFNFKNIFYIPFNKSLLVRNICLPQIKPVADSYFPKEVNEIRTFYLEYLKKTIKVNVKVGDKIYISRKKSVKRKIENESDVERLVINYGFSIVNNEDYSFQEQLSIYANAKFLISIHGAGLTNMIFMNNDAAVLELHKRKTNSKDWHSFAFWYLADALNFHYYHQLCDPTDPEASFFDANFIVDIVKLRNNIELMIS